MIETTETRVVTVEDRHVLVREVTDTQVVFGGEQGPPGPPGSIGPPGPPGSIGLPGPAGAASVEINFSFGDATPAAAATALANKLVYGVQIHIRTPFNGVGAALTVGDSAQPDRLMKANENDVLTIGANTTAPAHAYAINTSVLLSINPGAGATQGAGVLILGIQQ